MNYQLNSDLGFVYDLSNNVLSDLGSMEGAFSINGLEPSDLRSVDHNSSNPDDSSSSWSLYYDEENSVAGPVAAAGSGGGPGQQQQSGFTQRALQHWGPENCLEWGLHICQKYNIDKLYFDIGTLGQTNGAQLTKLKQSGFCSLLGDQYGGTFYKELQNMKKNRSTEVDRSYLENGVSIGQSVYSVSSDSYIPSMDTYATNGDSNADLGLSQYSVPLAAQSFTTMDSFSTTYSSTYNDNLTRTVPSPTYTMNSDQCVSNIESYSINYNSPYSDNNQMIDHSSHTIKSKEHGKRVDSYSACYKSPYIGNNERVNQNPYRVKPEENVASKDLHLVNSQSPYSENIPIIEESQYSTNLNPYHSTMNSFSPTSSYSQDFQDSVNPEFELTGNLEDADSESDVTIDYEDPTWDLPEETWKQIDITNTNLDLNFDQFELENTDMIDSPTRVKRKSGNGHAKKKSTQPSHKMSISADCVEDIVRKTKGAAKRERCPRSWEFLIRLLMNSQTNPSIIRWEDESQYIFRLVKADSIIQIWNAKSEKSSPNKDNFARSLRYHYKKGILIPVPEKQLVYKCGPKAIEYLNTVRKTLS